MGAEVVAVAVAAAAAADVITVVRQGIWQGIANQAVAVVVVATPGLAVVVEVAISPAAVVAVTIVENRGTSLENVLPLPVLDTSTNRWIFLSTFGITLI